MTEQSVYDQFNGISKKEYESLVTIFGEEKTLKILAERFPDKPENPIELKEAYAKIIEVLKKYCDLKEEYYSLIALWIIGTYFHKQFQTFPYLYFNAMKGSGKTRLLRLILSMCKNGRLVNSLSESVLFRTASQRTFGIDEFENVGSHEKQALRELLNSAYKKGTCVERAVKVKSNTEENYRIDTFDLYCPIVMANIWGMAEVLSDRCISIVIDKSSNKKITKLLELFENEPSIKFVKSMSLVSLVSFDVDRRIHAWNFYITDTNGTNSTNDTNDTDYTFFTKIDQTGLDSRHLELFFPLFLIADACGSEIFENTLNLAQEITKQKKEDDVLENRDVSFLEFIVTSEATIKGKSDKGFITESDLLGLFKLFIGYDDRNEEHKWVTSHWIGRALKRLNLIIERVRHSKGRIVHINIAKAKEKIKMFRHEQEPELEKLDDRRKTINPIDFPDRRKVC